MWDSRCTVSRAPAGDADSDFLDSAGGAWGAGAAGALAVGFFGFACAAGAEVTPAIAKATRASSSRRAGIYGPPSRRTNESWSRVTNGRFGLFWSGAMKRTGTDERS